MKEKNISKFQEIVSRRPSGGRGYLLLLWALLGPGVIAALADNDAGGIISYSVTGTQFGIGLFIPLTFCLILVTYTVQEMAMRLGVVSSKGYTRLVRERYNKIWMFYLMAALLGENLITLLTEFIGMSAGLVILGLPLWGGVLISLSLVVSITAFAGYWVKERLALLVGLLNLSFIAVALVTKPSFHTIGRSFLTWSVPANSHNVILYVIALIGNAVAPWMIFYQNSAYIDKGVASKNIRLGRIDTLIGCICQVLIAACIIIVGASLFGKVPDVANAGPATIIAGLNTNSGFWAALLFGLGLFDAGLLASITVSLSSAWSVAEAFGWAKSLNDKVTEAPKFYAIYFVSAGVAAGGVLIPHLPLNYVAVVAQVLGGILLIPILIFLVRLSSDRQLMRNYGNSVLTNVMAWAAVALLVGIALAAIMNAIFPGIP